MDDQSILCLAPREPIAAPVAIFQPQPEPRSSWLAFLLSLACPGAGHFYCGKSSRALWIMSFFFLALALAIYFTLQLGTPEGDQDSIFLGPLLKIVIFLYGFAFLDAFFTAREMTIGTDAFIAESPRVAAILNLLTRGFGYFYLGQRKLGFAVFFGFMFLHALLAKTPLGALSLELISVFIAMDAYRIAREAEKEILATVKLPAETGHSAWAAFVPLSLASLLIAGYLVVFLVSIAVPDYSHVDQSSTRLLNDSQGAVYQNSDYNVTLRVPESWTIKYDAPAYILMAVRSDRACSASLQPLPAWPFSSLASFKQQLMYTISQNKDLTVQLLQERPTFLSSLAAFDIHLFMKQGTKQWVEHHVVAKERMTFYDFSTFELADDQGNVVEPSCTTDLLSIRDNLSLRR